MNCHMFFPYGQESNRHRAFCVMKLAPEVRDSRQASGTPEPVVVTHQGRKSTSTQALRQIVRETLRSVTHTNAAGMCQTAATGQCPDSMSHTAESDEQDIEIIPGDSRYWEDWENEVQYNSGRSSITEVAPQLPSETSNQPPNQFSSTEHNNNCGSIIARQNDEYIEEDCKNPLVEANETGVSLDLRVGPGEQSIQPDGPTNALVGQTRHTDDSYLVSEDYLKEVKKIKE